MSRSPVSTRVAGPDDVPLLVELWEAAGDVGARAERAVNPIAIRDVPARLAEAVASEDCRIVIATSAERAVGMVVLRRVRYDPLSDVPVVQLSHLMVAPGMRRRGVGHALLTAAAEYAEAQHVEHLAVGVYPSLRDASRFYARLGFAAVMVQRVAPVAVLRRRLGSDAGHLPRVDDLVRRRSRGRATLPLRGPVPGQREVRRTPEAVD